MNTARRINHRVCATLAAAILLLCSNSVPLFGASGLLPGIEASLTAATSLENDAPMTSAVISAIAQRPDQVSAIIERAVALTPQWSYQIIASASRAYPAFASQITAANEGAHPSGRVKSPDLVKPAEPAPAGNWWHDGWSLTLYAGRLSTSDTSDIFAADGEFDDAGAVGAALSKELSTSWKHLVWEAEVQANQHVGDQDHVELDALILARWTSFPWNDVVRTSFAIGNGLSYATKTPKLERAAHGESAAKLLNYVIGEITLAPPSNEHISLAIRYQHRSGMFGTFSGVGEASTIFAFGMKYHF